MLHVLDRKVLEYVRRYGLFAAAQRVLLAVSGGADSTALLHVLVSLRRGAFLDAEFVCAHINHQLRGPASDEDERFVVAQATGLCVPVVTRTVDVRAHADERRLSLETAGRQLRLAALGEIAREQQCAWIATGHQKDDNAETILHRLQRGTGLRGLAGIRPRRPLDDGLWLARPLLSVTRGEIVGYLDRRRLPWREDHTNADHAYTRNFIRHRLLPALQRASHRCLVAELSDLSASAGMLYDRIQREAEEARLHLVRSATGAAAIDAARLASLPEMVAIELVRQVLVELGCGERDLTRQHYHGVLRLARRSDDARSVSLPDGFIARYEHKRIVLDAPEPALAGRMELAAPPPPAGPAPATIPVPGRVQYADYEIHAEILDRYHMEPGKITSGTDRLRECFDLDRLHQPIVVRTRRPGDKFRPLGLVGDKKIGKFLTAAKVPRRQRRQILVLADQEKIIWVCPVRVSEQAKVTPATRQILVLEATPLHSPTTLDSAQSL